MIIARSRLVDMADNAVDALAHAIEDGNAGGDDGAAVAADPADIWAAQAAG